MNDKPKPPPPTDSGVGRRGQAEDSKPRPPVKPSAPPPPPVDRGNIHRRSLDERILVKAPPPTPKQPGG